MQIKQLTQLKRPIMVNAQTNISPGFRQQSPSSISQGSQSIEQDTGKFQRPSLMNIDDYEYNENEEPPSLEQYVQQTINKNDSKDMPQNVDSNSSRSETLQPLTNPRRLPVQTLIPQRKVLKHINK